LRDALLFCCLVVPVCSGDLSQVIEDMRAKKLLFAEIDIWRFIYFISLALVHMHSKRVMHRGEFRYQRVPLSIIIPRLSDIKPSNVYITQAGEVKLGDLGLARIFRHFGFRFLVVSMFDCRYSPKPSAARSRTMRRPWLALLITCLLS
jgi:serine/threonine protein kinase